MPITYTMTKNPANTALIYDFGDWSRWDEDLAGAYLNLVAEFEKLDIEAGLRGEYTRVEVSVCPQSLLHGRSIQLLRPLPQCQDDFETKPFEQAFTLLQPPD